jgi:hypothetical protein
VITREQAAHAARVTEFWSFVQRGTPAECWPWTGYQEDGYGRFFYEGRMRGAHELAVTFTTGEVRAPELDTCHACHNPICCNPHHVRFDTRRSNVADMDSAGRRVNGTAKLTAEDVRTMRVRRAHGARQLDLAREYGVTDGQVSMIIRGLRWKNAGGPIETERKYRRGGRNTTDDHR